MNLKKLRSIQEKFSELYSKTPLIVRSPGRINLIGEHTDYNDGFVLPAAIDKEILLALAANQTDICNLFSLDLQEFYSFRLDQLKKSSSSWANYIIGVVQQLNQLQLPVRGFDCVFGGDIPIGAGLSSSAALECGVAFGLSQLWAFDIPKLEIAKLAQKAEREFVGVQCGLMDQYANMFGQLDHLLLLDCREGSHQTIKVNFSGYSLLLFNTNVKHQLGNSEYNIRRQECEAGVSLLQKCYPEISSLRDCNKPMLAYLKEQEYETIHKRCEYVVEENQRVVQGSEDLMKGDLEAFGKKMYQSHQGLSEKYQVSCQELDLLVDLTRKEETVLGARMMGGGFGGCTINLIQEHAVGELVRRIEKKYLEGTSKDMTVYPVNIADGTSLVTELIK